MGTCDGAVEGDWLNNSVGAAVVGAWVGGEVIAMVGFEVGLEVGLLVGVEVVGLGVGSLGLRVL